MSLLINMIQQNAPELFGLLTATGGKVAEGEGGVFADLLQDLETNDSLPEDIKALMSKQLSAEDMEDNKELLTPLVNMLQTQPMPEPLREALMQFSKEHNIPLQSPVQSLNLQQNSKLELSTQQLALSDELPTDTLSISESEVSSQQNKSSDLFKNINEFKQLMNQFKDGDSDSSTSFSKAFKSLNTIKEIASLGQGPGQVAVPTDKLIGIPNASAPIFANANPSGSVNIMQMPTPIASNAAWAQSLSESTVWLNQQPLKSATLHINPPELGPMEIKISMRDDSSSIVFASAHQSVRDTIELAIPKLRELFENNGMGLQDVEVQDQQLFNQQDNSAHQSEEGLVANPGSHSNNASDEVIETTSTTLSLSPYNVDFYA